MVINSTCGTAALTDLIHGERANMADMMAQAEPISLRQGAGRIKFLSLMMQVPTVNFHF
jgi:hypothetical protein